MAAHVDPLLNCNRCDGINSLVVKDLNTAARWLVESLLAVFANSDVGSAFLATSNAGLGCNSRIDGHQPQADERPAKEG